MTKAQQQRYTRVILNSTPNTTWTFNQLAQFVSVAGNCPLPNRWKLGKALALAIALGKLDGNAKRDWLAGVLPGYSRAKIDRLVKLAGRYPEDGTCPRRLQMTRYRSGAIA